MSDKKLIKKQNDTNFCENKAKTIENVYGSIKSEKIKSHSINKYQVSIDKEQILKEFYLYKLNATNKSNKNSKLNKSYAKSSKSRTSRGNLLIQVRSVKGRKPSEDNLSYKTNKNIRKINRLENFNYNELCRKIEENKQINEKRLKETTINTKHLDNNEKTDKNKSKKELINKADTMDPYNTLLENKPKSRQIKNNFTVIQNEKEYHSQKISNLKTYTNDNSNGFLNISTQSRNSKSNFEKYQSYLNEKISYLKNSIQDKRGERNHLVLILNEDNTNEQTIHEERLKSDITNYKKMKQNFILTSSKLTEEINDIKNEIAKYSSPSTNFSTLSGFPHSIVKTNGTGKENRNQFLF